MLDDNSKANWKDPKLQVSNARQFHYTGLQYADEMKSLIDGISATGKDGCVSFQKFKDSIFVDGSGSSSFFEDLNSPIDLDMDDSNAYIPKDDNLKKREKHQKKNKVDTIDDKLMTVLQTLGDSDNEPSIKQCNEVLDEMIMLTMDNPIYIVACRIFCENKTYREQWMMFAQKPEQVRINRIKMNAKN
ncbi:hypothetical protein M5689_024719 [Euphorbia peplus]|nr:hypothetical protein M5689_024719 [Euphorbia peplus]